MLWPTLGYGKLKKKQRRVQSGSEEPGRDIADVNIEPCNIPTEVPMIDFHCHILPGLDDGAVDQREALSMARILATYGFREIICTPHCLTGSYDNTPDQVAEDVEKLQHLLKENGVPLTLFAGMEYHLDEFFYLELDHLQPLGETSLVLAEIPTQGSDELVLEGLQAILDKGLTPLLAHPERSFLLSQGAPWFRRIWRRAFPFNVTDEGDFSGTLLNHMREMGCLFQGNIGSFCGHYGQEVQRRALYYLQTGLYDYFGSDGHHTASLEKILSRGLPRLHEQKRAVG